ncbi:MAG: homoserine O-succinyltransferase [Clostridiales bacterium]|jgi:homoserine O-succinyltransferase|nr:homoserine O-succinyltransferase [Clostridiales bacterium]
MPVNIPFAALPAVETLSKENIFVMTHDRAGSQDIRPLRIAMLNLMPAKATTETQLLRVLSNTSLQVEVTLLSTASYQPRNTSRDHLKTFYRTFDDVANEQFDGLIITGAPVEQMRFEDVAYWDELQRVLDWAGENVFSTFFICWAAQAGLYHYYGITKQPLSKKLFGVYPHTVKNRTHKLLRGFDDVFYAPHSRHTTVRVADVAAHLALEVLAVSEQAGMYIAASRDGRRIFVTGHGEYDAETLGLEYERDINAGLPIEPPFNYYPDNDSTQQPLVTWRAHGHLLFFNWLNYFVYQETPYAVEKIKEYRHH